MKFLSKCLNEALIMVFCSKFVFGSIGGVVAFFIIPRQFFGLEIKYSVIIAAGVLLAWFMLAFVISIIKNIKIWVQTYYLNNAFGDGILLIKSVNEEINQYNNGQQQINNTLQNICNETKRYYDKRFEAKCGVSIKLPKNPVDKLEDMTVVNVARDENSAKTRDTDLYKQQTHSVFGNTAYMAIITRLNRRPTKAYYLNNDIYDDDSYENTSQDAYPDKKYPYASEFVFPIRALPRNEQPNQKVIPSDITGFFCVDCESKNKFHDDKYSVGLMKIIADSLFRIVQPS
ncbi:MAG: hypothetical protein II939_04580 [Bacteroidales bacterium]|nr:hypothetical protein [Bacteroidales bacterium]